MTTPDSHAHPSEAERIRGEFARRARELPSNRYSWIHSANRFQYSRLWSQCIETLASAGAFPLDGKRILDIGCGGGSWLLEFLQWEAKPGDLAGIDLVEERVQIARRNLPAADIRSGDASRLPWPDDHFDVVTQFTVFTSILDGAMRRAVAKEMMRVTSPGGFILWYDFAMNNINNPNVRGIPSSELALLFPRCSIQVRKVTLAPPVARLAARYSWFFARSLEWLPFLRTHRLAVIRKGPAADGGSELA